jgi:predicted RNA-binding protein with RPS1 domain
MSQKFVNEIKLKTIKGNQSIIINLQDDKKIKLSIKTSNMKP